MNLMDDHLGLIIMIANLAWFSFGFSICLMLVAMGVIA